MVALLVYSDFNSDGVFGTTLSHFQRVEPGTSASFLVRSSSDGPNLALGIQESFAVGIFTS